MLVEREHFLVTLTALIARLTDTAAGDGALVFLGGEAGIGKTSLTASLAAAAPDGVTVRRGGCDNLATAAALGPLLDALPELGDLVAEPSAVDRPRLFRRIRTILSAAPTLLLLEDVHWADEATLELLRFLGRRVEGSPLMIVATFRTDEVGPDHPLTVVLGDLATGPAVVRMQLPALSVAGVQALIEQAGSGIDAGPLHHNTGGNPFYVTEVLATGTDQLPESVRDAVLARASRLSPPARRVLNAAAILGQRADWELLIATSGESHAAIDECRLGGVLVGDSSAVEFRHELSRVAIELSVSKVDLVHLHRAALDEMRRRGSRDDRRMARHAAGCGEREAVSHYAVRAATSASRLGAHREAAQQYRLALDWTEENDATRADLLAQRSYECYLTDQLESARADRLAALELYERAGATLEIGVTNRWLSRLSWFLGHNADAERYAATAIATLEPLGRGPALAMAYSNMAHLRMLDDDVDDTISWGQRAIDLAREIGEREVEIHALNNVGTAMATIDYPQGITLLAQSLDLALADDAHEHAARAYTNLSCIAVTCHRHREADRYLRAGISYCTERDLDSWRLYMSAWLARSLVEQGRYAAAQPLLDEILRHPQLSPVTRIPADIVAAQLAIRRGQESGDLLVQALTLALSTGEAQRLVPVAATRAEAAWISGRLSDIEGEIEQAWPAATAFPREWELGELAWWLAVAGSPRPVPIPPATPFALMLAGEFRSAAQAWREADCPLWAAYALCASPDLTDARAGLEILDGLEVPAVRAAVLRDRHARGQAVPRGPRPSSHANPGGLTDRETEVLDLLADGLSNAELATRLFLSEKTVGHHVSAVLRKLGEPTRSRVVAAALRRGIVSPR